jgi:voltage-gated potassium channel
VTGIFIQIYRLVRALFRILEEPEGRALTVLAALQLISGAVFYALVEGWRWFDAVYFSVTTLTTVGFGDLAPATDAGKIFTILYVLTGVGLFVSFLDLVAEKSRPKRIVGTAARNRRAEHLAGPGPCGSANPPQVVRGDPGLSVTWLDGRSAAAFGGRPHATWSQLWLQNRDQIPSLDPRPPRSFTASVTLSG